MFKSSFMRCLFLAMLLAAVLFPTAPLSADGGDQGEVTDSSGIVEEVLEWLMDLMEPAEGDPDEGETGPRVDPAG